jgi:hypothetical protein
MQTTKVVPSSDGRRRLDGKMPGDAGSIRIETRHAGRSKSATAMTVSATAKRHSHGKKSRERWLHAKGSGPRIVLKYASFDTDLAPGSC